MNRRRIGLALCLAVCLAAPGCTLAPEPEHLASVCDAPNQVNGPNQFDRPAFPGAEGAGRGARGGRCGDVYTVASLADSGPGSLRFGIQSATGPRTIVFAVAGTIWLESMLRIDRPFLTLAGQTAPGQGITVAGRPTRIDGTHDVIVRYLRFRPGPGKPGSEPDALGIVRSQDIIVDHVSTSWAVDEVLSVTHDSHRVSVQWSFITEALHNAGHHKGNHGYGSLIDGGDITFHHDLFAHNRSRNPRPGGVRGRRTRVVFANNVIHNPGGRFGYAGGERFDLVYVGNFGIAGPSSFPETRALFMAGGPGNHIHSARNWRDLLVDGVIDGRPAGWSAFRGAYTPAADPPFALDLVLDPAPRALERVLAQGGASLRRDPVDQRIVASVRNQSGQHIDSPEQVGGWPVLASGTPEPDSDADGMPDAWEASQHSDPLDPRDRNHPTADGFTALEAYLHQRTLNPSRG